MRLSGTHYLNLKQTQHSDLFSFQRPTALTDHSVHLLIGPQPFGVYITGDPKRQQISPGNTVIHHVTVGL